MRWSDLSPMERSMILGGGMFFTGGLAISIVMGRRFRRFSKVQVEAPPDVQRSIVRLGDQFRDDLIRGAAESSVLAANMATGKSSQPISPSVLDIMTARLYTHLGLQSPGKVS
jgi:hypothetical protein